MQSTEMKVVCVINFLKSCLLCNLSSENGECYLKLMGLRQSREQNYKEEQKRLDNNFLILCDDSLSLEERTKSFVVLQNHYVPNTQFLPTYSNELARVFALKYELWTEKSYILSNRKEVVRDAVKGCLFGNALGDATGLATEFLSKQRIEEYYGPNFTFYPGCSVFPDVHRVSFTPGDWTDDTDQLVLALISLLETRGIFDPRNFASKLLDWKEHGFPGLGDSSGCGLGQMTKAVLQSTGYVLDPITVSRKVWERSGRKNAANGAIMRTAIAGIPYFWDLGIVEKNAVDMCLTTHADPRCVTSCVIVSLIIALILQEKNNGSAIDVESIINTSRETGVKYLPTSEDQEDLLHHTDSANDLSSLCLDETGKIGFTYKCLGVGLWALRQAQRGEGFPEIIQHITREGGDADTNCAVAGALVGVYLGFSQLPQSWLKIMPYEVWLDGWVQKILFVLHLL